MVISQPESVGPDNFHGFVRVNMMDLRDQLIHELWLDLLTLEGKPGLGKIRLSFQWIHSNVTFFADLLDKVQVRITAETEEKRLMEAALESFRGLLYRNT